MSANAAAGSLQYGSGSNAMVSLIGRVLIALIFAYFGYMKAMNFQGTIGYFAKWGFPMPPVAASLAVLFELGGGVLLIVGWKTRWVAWALVLYCAIATLVAHRFWGYPPEQAFNQTSHFFKNLSLIGGLIYLATFGPGAMSVDKR
jgi:putative oxidoreductase